MIPTLPSATIGKKDDVPPSSSFTDALVVPQLAQTCVESLSNRAIFDPGYGLKQLRSVSKEARNVLQVVIKGFTMRLGGPDLTHMVTFLKTLTLTNLVIKFDPFAVYEIGEHVSQHSLVKKTCQYICTFLHCLCVAWLLTLLGGLDWSKRQ